MNRLSLIFGFSFLIPVLSFAQISISGIYDFEIKKGGKDSSPESNKVGNGYLQLNIHSLNLFLDASVTEDISLTSKLATSKRGGNDAIGMNVELAYVTFANVIDRVLNISVGKILTPFGTYTRRQLSPDNPLIGTPLFFYYATNVSPISGYLDSAGVSSAQSYGGRLSTIYYGGYSAGFEVFGGFADDLLTYDLALMNAPLSSPNPGVNLDKQPAFHGRIAIHPAIWGTFGASFATGSFLERGPVNNFLDWNWNVEDYTQRTIGVDLNLSYTYYELNVEYIINRFHSPYVVSDSSGYTFGLTGMSAFDLTSDELLVDLKFDAPFYPGLYLAARYNAVMFGSIKNSSTYWGTVPWDHDVQRLEVAIGYKVARGVLIKVGYQWTEVDVKPRPKLDVFGSQISVSF